MDVRRRKLEMVREKRQPVVSDGRQMDNLRVFHEVARVLTSNLELKPLLRAILSKMEEFFGPEGWSLLMVDESTDELYYALSASETEPVGGKRRIKMGEGIAGYVAKSGNPLVIPDVYADRDWARFAQQHPELHLQSIACLPIRHGGHTLGVLQLHNSKLDLLPDSSIAFLRVLCDYAAIALQNARHVDLIQHLSITDDCTGLFNSRHLYTLLEAEIAEARSSRVVSIRPEFSLLFFDLDHFKSVNDTHGHLVGSRLLAEIGNLIKRSLGPNHAGFRYGGDEFVALLRGLDKQRAKDLALQLRESLLAARFITGTDGNLSLSVSASFGLATYPEDGDSLQSIVRSADAMMYVAKAEGRNRLAIADPNKPTEFAQPKTSRHA